MRVKIENEPRIIVTFNEIEIREITRALKLLVDKRSISGPSELNGLFLNFESIIRELEEEPAAGE